MFPSFILNNKEVIGCTFRYMGLCIINFAAGLYIGDNKYIKENDTFSKINTKYYLAGKINTKEYFDNEMLFNYPHKC